MFVSDLHGRLDRYANLFRVIEQERPEAVFLGGDLLPSSLTALQTDGSLPDDFIKDFMIPALSDIKTALGTDYPRVLAILGNDDLRAEEEGMRAGEERGVLEYVQGRKSSLGRHTVYGYSFVNPTPFHLKDWERYDVSRYVDPGCVSPEEGRRSLEVSRSEKRYSTIKEDLDNLVSGDDLTNAVFLFHVPPYQTKLDRADLDGKLVEGVPLDLYVGSIAVRRFIEEKQPLLTLHGHVHESARLTGSWRDKIGRTWMFSAAHDGPELAIVRFSADDPGSASRELI
ncbi:MAG: metallophosphoesterase [Candidatus Eisenbacteria bacterium]